MAYRSAQPGGGLSTLPSLPSLPDPRNLGQQHPTPRSSPLISAFPDLTPRTQQLPQPLPPSHQPPVPPSSSHSQYQPQARLSDPGRFPYSPASTMWQSRRGIGTPGGGNGSITTSNTSGGTTGERTSPFLPAPNLPGSSILSVAQIRREGEGYRDRDRPRDIDGDMRKERNKDGEDEVMEEAKPSLRNLLN